MPRRRSSQARSFRFGWLTLTRLRFLAALVAWIFFATNPIIQSMATAMHLEVVMLFWVVLSVQAGFAGTRVARARGVYDRRVRLARPVDQGFRRVPAAVLRSAVFMREGCRGSRAADLVRRHVNYAT